MLAAVHEIDDDTMIKLRTMLTEAIANAVIRRSGTRGIVVAVFTVSWLLTFCGINVFVIIFTVYPIACAFFKVGDIPRSLIPACVLGACVSQQMYGTVILSLQRHRIRKTEV